MHTLLFCLLLCLSRASTFEVDNFKVKKHQIVSKLFENIESVGETRESLCQKHFNILRNASQLTNNWAYRSMYIFLFELDDFISMKKSGFYVF